MCFARAHLNFLESEFLSLFILIKNSLLLFLELFLYLRIAFSFECASTAKIPNIIIVVPHTMPVIKTSLFIYATPSAVRLTATTSWER